MRCAILIVFILAISQCLALSLTDSDQSTWTYTHCTLPISPPIYHLQRSVFVPQTGLCGTETDANQSITFALGGSCPYLTSLVNAETIHASALVFSSPDGQLTDLNLKPDDYQSLIPAIAISIHDYTAIRGLLAKNPNLIVTIDSKDARLCSPQKPADDGPSSGGPSSGAIFGYFLLTLVGVVILCMCCAQCCKKNRTLSPTQNPPPVVCPELPAPVIEVVNYLEVIQPQLQVSSNQPSIDSHNKESSPLGDHYHVIQAPTSAQVSEHKEHEAIEMPSRASDADDIV
jgi:hypothetical protein